MPKKPTAKQMNRDIDEVLQARQKRAAKTSTVKAEQPRWDGQDEYETRELRGAHGKLSEVEKAPLAERKEAQQEFFEAMRDNPEIVGERIAWLLNGSYGYGSKLMADRIIASPRMNQSAALTTLTAAFEWSCPAAMTAAAWKKLSPSEKAKLEANVKRAIKNAGEE